MSLKLKYIFAVLPMVVLVACHQKNTEKEKSDDEKIVPHTPVTVIHISTGPLVEYFSLNATSSFRQSAYVKSNINGYVKEARVGAGDKVSKGDVLFLVETKESENIGSTINKLDTSFHFNGKVTIRANTDGFISLLSHKAGDYVQDGEQLAVISDLSSFRFIMNLPYELKQYALQNNSVSLLLPDDTRLTGTLEGYLPSVDLSSQTQQVVIKVNSATMIPENLVAEVRLVKRTKTSVPNLPRTAVLSDEVQTNFWVMKMMDSTTAVRIQVKKGIESGDRIEIVSPKFTDSDLILNSGNYGLPDTAKVIVQQLP